MKKQLKEFIIAVLYFVSLIFVAIGFLGGWIIINIHVGYLWADKILSKLGEQK